MERGGKFLWEKAQIPDLQAKNLYTVKKERFVFKLEFMRASSLKMCRY